MAGAGDQNSGTIPCSKCKAQNEVTRNKCRSCGAHLFLICRKCRQKFARFMDLCPNCGENNHQHGNTGNETFKQKLVRKAPQLLFYLILLVLLYYLFKQF